MCIENAVYTKDVCKQIFVRRRCVDRNSNCILHSLDDILMSNFKGTYLHLTKNRNEPLIKLDIVSKYLLLNNYNFKTKFPWQPYIFDKQKISKYNPHNYAMLRNPNLIYHYNQNIIPSNISLNFVLNWY